MRRNAAGDAAAVCGATRWRLQCVITARITKHTRANTRTLAHTVSHTHTHTSTLRICT